MYPIDFSEKIHRKHLEIPHKRWIRVFKTTRPNRQPGSAANHYHTTGDPVLPLLVREKQVTTEEVRAREIPSV